MNLPVTDDFRHFSPYGTIEGKAFYLDIVQANKEKFLGHSFKIHDVIYRKQKACMRYTAVQGDFRLEIGEWHYFNGGDLIKKIVAYSNIPGETSEERKLSETDQDQA